MLTLCETPCRLLAGQKSFDNLDCTAIVLTSTKKIVLKKFSINLHYAFRSVRSWSAWTTHGFSWFSEATTCQTVLYNPDILVIRTAGFILQNTTYRKLYGFHIRRLGRPYFLQLEPSLLPDTQLQDVISCMRSGFTLLESESIFSDCYINPGNEILIRQFQIHMLTHIYLSFIDEENLLLCGSYPCPNHHKNWFASPPPQKKKQPVIQEYVTLTQCIYQVNFMNFNCRNTKKLLICPHNRRLSSIP